LQERVLAFLLKEHAGSDSIPKAALLQFLQQEYEVRSQEGRVLLSQIGEPSLTAPLCLDPSAER
jgi:hypothetical protein